MIAKTFMRNFNGLKPETFFQCQFSAGITEDLVFGPINVKKLREEGIMEHNVDGMLPTAKMAFLDEFMDASDVIQRSMLEILNERSYSHPPQLLDCPLHMAVMTSNFMKVTENLVAVLDRILFKVDVDYIKKPDARMAFYKAVSKRKPASIKGAAFMLAVDNRFEFEDLQKLSVALSDIAVPEDVLVKFDEFQKELHIQLKLKESERFSDRRLGKLINVIKCSAMLEGRKVAIHEDIELLKMGLIDPGHEESVQVFDGAYEKLVLNPIKEQSFETLLNETQAKLTQYQTMEFSKDKTANADVRMKRIEELNSVFEKRLGAFKGTPNEDIENRVRTTKDLLKQALKKGK